MELIVVCNTSYTLRTVPLGIHIGPFPMSLESAKAFSESDMVPAAQLSAQNFNLTPSRSPPPLEQSQLRSSRAPTPSCSAFSTAFRLMLQICSISFPWNISAGDLVLLVGLGQLRRRQSRRHHILCKPTLGFDFTHGHIRRQSSTSCALS